MILQSLTPPATEPLALNDAKLYLRVDNSSEDTLVGSLITAARERAELHTQRQLVTATYLYSAGDDWDAQTPVYDAATQRIYLPKPPLQSVASVKYIDGSGTLQTADPSTYRVVTGDEPGYIVLTTLPPYDTTREDAIQITFTCGYGPASAVPAGIVTAMKWIIGEAYGVRSDAEAVAETSVVRLLNAYKVWQ